MIISAPHRFAFLMTVFPCMFLSASVPVQASEKSVLPSIAQRFETGIAEETPDFQRHIVPLIGKLGCNGRACHGSFQGRGGFRLSLFGYDFKTDHEELYGRLDTETPSESLILQKALMQIQHEGGQRLKEGSWEHHVMLRWIQSEAPSRAEDAATLQRLDVTPSELLFSAADQTQQLRAVAVWSDGVREDVTDLCRFQSNDDQVAEIGQDGIVTSAEPGDTHVVVFYDSAVVPVPVIRPVTDQFGEKYPDVPMPTEVDRLVVEKLRKVGIIQSDLCSDEEFLRRASLDVTGTLPTPAEIREFLADSSEDKRARKIDELLERPGYVAWWTTRLCDFTGNSDDKLNNVTPVRQEASKQWYAWLEKRVRDNVPYDKLIEGIVLAKSRNDGESFREYSESMSSLYHRGGVGAVGYADREGLAHFWSRQNFQSSEDRVIAFAYTFLGTRIQCAQCHKHPFDRWTQDDFQQFEGFFRTTRGRATVQPSTREEYNAMVAGIEGAEGLRGNDLRRVLASALQDGMTVPFPEVYTTRVPAARAGAGRRNAVASSPTARPLGGSEVNLSEFEDPRQPLMDWLRSPENPLFAKAFVNRVWAAYFGRGIVQPSDDLNLANPPVNQGLVDYLSSEFIASGFDMKWLHREILNSRTYQLSWIPNSTNRMDEKNFSRSVPRRLPAEVAYDILVQATLNSEKNAAVVSDVSGRAVSIPGSGLRRRANGEAAYAMTVFGRSIRESNCDCDRTDEPSLLQTIFLRNDDQVLAMLDANDGWLREVCRDNEIPFSSRSSGGRTGVNSRQLAQLKARYQQQLKRLKQQIQLAEKDGLKGRLPSLRNQLGKLRERAVAAGVVTPTAEEAEALAAAQEAEKANASANVDAETIVREAYLRTLSRSPNDDELAVSVEFINASEDAAEGVRGVLWALVNTREFLVNR